MIATFVEFLVIVLAALVVIALAVCLVIIWAVTTLIKHVDYGSQRVESELMEIGRNTRKP